LTPFSAEELDDVVKAFAERSDSAAEKAMLSNLKCNEIDFSNVEFDSGFWAAGFIFPGNVKFSGATFFGDANFSGTTFSGNAQFEGTTFSAVSEKIAPLKTAEPQEIFDLAEPEKVAPWKEATEKVAP
jgi:uncharacterized protein YjbI with pentapeptide repeats